MGFSWTEEQKQVIELRNRNLLVAAAAGSGKTAVLVERIVSKVLDQAHPVDIDRMLIVTFTKAAAAEMRERVSEAIERRMELEPDHPGLQRQYTLVHNAQITTIDSFCLYVVRNYFQTIGLEPSFRIADPGELELLKADVAEEVMEQHYQQKSEGFLQLADRYATAKSDAALVDFMLRLYEFSQSYPWPQEYLSSLAGHYRLEDADQMNSRPWMQGLLQYLGFITADLKRQMEYAQKLCQDNDGPGMYLAAVQDDLSLLEELGCCTSYEQYADRLSSLKFTKLGVKRKYEGSVEKQEQVKSLRKVMKDTLGSLADAYFYQDSGQMLIDLHKILPDVEALAELAQSFTDAYQAKKAERNLLDFSDIEHFALKILIDEKTKEPTAAARELREIYEEIMIDEYQDSNFVQETILRAVSREELGQNNIFMVGDVKQSIYRFRLARPQLFIEKYRTYTSDESTRQKIDLHQNFRSRREVIEGVNEIFYKIMHEDLGNVEYDSQAALYAGAAYPEPEQADAFISELLLAQASAQELAEAGMDDWQEMEARMAAARIHELMETQLVTDKQTGELRPLHYRDIVILLRSITGWADTFLKVFTEAGIPAYTTSQTGYFGTVEIQTILSMLSILDNPLQDIPLASVLASPIGGLTGEELARIKTSSREHFFYLALQDYMQYGDGAAGSKAPAYEMNRDLHQEDCVQDQGDSDSREKDACDRSIRHKLSRFFKMYEKLRSMTAYTPIHQLIQIVLEKTGYASYIQAMPAGRQRRANVDMLLEKAIAYEKSSYKGLFHFVRYIEKLKKYEVDFGEADITSENEDVVRMMSIHKSKGLEFPVVFVCGMGKQFNRQDVRNRLILHPEYGIGLDYIDADKRIRKPGFIKKILENEIAMENQGEELRILYVALTRAKEKLIMTAAVKEEPQQADDAVLSKDGPMGYFARSHAASYLDWVYPIVSAGQVLPAGGGHMQAEDSTGGHMQAEQHVQAEDSAGGHVQAEQHVQAENSACSHIQAENGTSGHNSCNYRLRVYHTQDITLQETVEAAVEQLDLMQLKQIYKTADRTLYEELDQKLSWNYPYEGDTDLKTKISVSELKHRRQMVLEEAVPQEEWFAPQRESIIPAFMRTEAQPQSQGAMRGSAVHKVMEEVDFVQSAQSTDRVADIRSQMDNMLAGARITQDMKQLVSPYMLARFLDSPLAARMAGAQQKGTLHKEQPFVMGVPASRVYEKASEELILIQGIVDVYWEEEGGLVILDYKTDVVKEPAKLIERYAVQLDLYAEALEKATGKPVKEKIIYSFHLQQEVQVG